MKIKKKVTAKSGTIIFGFVFVFVFFNFIIIIFLNFKIFNSYMHSQT